MDDDNDDDDTDEEPTWQNHSLKNIFWLLFLLHSADQVPDFWTDVRFYIHPLFHSTGLLLLCPSASLPLQSDTGLIWQTDTSFLCCSWGLFLIWTYDDTFFCFEGCLVLNPDSLNSWLFECLVHHWSNCLVLPSCDTRTVQQSEGVVPRWGFKEG